VESFPQQRVHYGFKAGINVCQLLGDDYINFRKGFNGGILANLQLQKNWTLQMEMVFSGKGSYYGKNYYLGPYWIRLHYIELPLSFQFHRKKVFYEAGFSLAYLNKYSEGGYNSYQFMQNYLYPFKSSDISLHAGTGYYFIKNWSINIRYSNSVLPIRKIPANQYNSVFTASLSYQGLFNKD
jgi:hypothetical protein